MKKKLTAEHKKKLKEGLKKSREENNKHLLDISGYEIWVDTYNFTVIKKEKNRHTFHTTLIGALSYINDEQKINNLHSDKSLEKVIASLKQSDENFEKSLKEIFGKSSKCLSLGTDDFIDFIKKMK